jgi:hypothetical protein
LNLTTREYYNLGNFVTEINFGYGK